MNLKNGLSILLGLVLLVGIGTLAAKRNGDTRPQTTATSDVAGDVVESDAAQNSPAVANTADVPSTPVENSAETVTENTVENTAETAAVKTATSISYDNASLPADPLGERTLGDVNAPVRIEEFSSLTCPHCAHFHRDTLAQLKEKYIDTGKVFFVFTDFPLNAPALDASMIARCLPPERYFAFIAYLYESQESWAFAPEYKNILRQNAKLAGMSDERFDSCLADTALKQGIADRMKDRGEKYSVKSTPSFVINNKHLVTGALPIAAFDEMVTKAAETENNLPMATGKDE